MRPVVLFDLDGTLLPMDQDVFTYSYFKNLTAKMQPFGLEAKSLEKGIWIGTEAMIKNDGACTNEEKFWQAFAECMGESVLGLKGEFESFYRVEFNEAKKYCGFNPKAAETVKKLKAAGYRIALATNPIFPAAATQNRIRWTGLEPDDFEAYTTYETCHFCKPNLKYYEELLGHLGVSATDCIMIGNDVGDDMVAKNLGMQVFLLTDCLINTKSEDISVYPHGGFDELLKFLEIL